ncbi:hypothetical protein PMI04_005695 [Sphingobium sp. AP49]|uniref:hypothetical protein n=1 Tax=Sphingobium sp. AP49 TaxID=1144307 RepID=UPI00026ED5C4|nr:hypothetical protein [Sphingobium sp. AP49]WHO40086.1 hypothetical protein PMI04_005695 [Sphingobium sp. AP49]
MIRPVSILLGLSLLGVTACGQPAEHKVDPGPDNAIVAQRNGAAAHNGQTPVPAPTGPLSCSADIGEAAAQKLVRTCTDVSPATHPPCNAANSCAMIEDEIARSCALFDGQGDPMPECTPAPKSAAAAAAVVQRYYAALNARDYGTAWTLWGDDGPAGQTMARFEAGFAATRATHVTIGRLEPGDAGAGSLYQPVPVTVEAELLDGTRQRFTGTYVVRRVNDVDGASAAQRRWHIDSAKLRPVSSE